MNELTSLAELLVIASFLGLLLRRINISPVIAYLVSGIIGVLLGVNYNDSAFQFITFLAVNLLSFEMGVSVNLLDLKKMFGKIIFIILTEFMIVFTIVLVISFILKLNILSTLLLTIIGFNTSSSIVYKLAEKSLDKSDLKLILSVASFEDALAFIVFSFITSHTFNITEIILASIISLVLGYLISKLLINPTVSFSEDSIILSGVASIFLFNVLSQILNIPSTLASFLLGMGTSVASNDNEKIANSLKPLTDFTLILFFFVAGSYIKLSIYLILAIPIAIILILTKYIAFSTAYWISGVEFIRAFRTGLFMTALSEFGIVISITALQENLPVSIAYTISTVVVALSSTIASIVTSRDRRIIPLLNSIYIKMNLTKVDSIIKKSNLSNLKIPNVIKSIIRYIIISIAITFSGTTIVYLLSILSPYLVFLSYFILGIVPVMLYLLLTNTIKEIKGKYGEYEPLINLFLSAIFVIINVLFDLFLIKTLQISFLLSILAISIASLISILFINRIRKILEDLEKIF